MASYRRTYVLDDSLARSGLALKHLTRKQFGQRLYTLMLQKGWTQAELARQADILRDSVSNYIRGNNFPEPVNLEKLAKALGVSSDELLPNITEAAIEMEQSPSLEVKSVPERPDEMLIRVNRIVKIGTVGKIIELLEADNAAD